jgi:sulfate/thiosulfate transport system substrate-binding protein
VEYVVPRATLVIENPVAVVDAYVDRHGSRDVAEAFVKFLAGAEAQRAFAEYGLRPLGAAGATLPPVSAPFGIADLGGWPAVMRTVFADGGVFDRASDRASDRRVAAR